MIKAHGRSALILVTGFLMGLGAPLHAGPDELNTPVFVTPSENAAQPKTAAQPSLDKQNAAPDQLNAVDRSLHENTATQSSAAAAPTEPRPARSAPVMAASADHSLWKETSLIGKIFIAFGALLMIASAARMFMA